jgi:putative colanic acid biosynthesis UDP-glucose lipid carrier transferase
MNKLIDSLELYGAVPIFNLRASPLDLDYSNLIKPVFDILVSSFVIVLNCHG